MVEKYILFFYFCRPLPRDLVIFHSRNCGSNARRRRTRRLAPPRATHVSAASAVEVSEPKPSAEAHSPKGEHGRTPKPSNETHDLRYFSRCWSGKLRTAPARAALCMHHSNGTRRAPHPRGKPATTAHRPPLPQFSFVFWDALNAFAITARHKRTD